jgi:hypothetical protein
LCRSWRLALPRCGSPRPGSYRSCGNGRAFFDNEDGGLERPADLSRRREDQFAGTNDVAFKVAKNVPVSGLHLNSCDRLALHHECPAADDLSADSTFDTEVMLRLEAAVERGILVDHALRPRFGRLLRVIGV